MDEWTLMLYQVGQGAKFTTLDGLPAGKNDAVQIISDITITKTYDIQSGMKFDGQGHKIKQMNSKAHALNMAKWCLGATAHNFKADTGPLTAAINVQGRGCAVDEWSQVGMGRLLNYNDSVDCVFKYGTHISRICCDYSIWGGDGDLSGAGPSGAMFYNMTVEVWAAYKADGKTQVDAGKPGGIMHAWRAHKSTNTSSVDCNLKAHGIREVFNWREWSGWHHKRLTALGDNGTGAVIGPLATDPDPTNFCDNILFEECDITLDNFLSLVAGVRNFKMHNGFLKTKQAAINCGGSVSGRLPPDDIEVTGTHFFSPAAWKGPGTNQRFINAQITLPNGQLHKVGPKGETI